MGEPRRKAELAELDHRTLLLRFIASLTLCDHMGDVYGDIDKVLDTLGIEYEDDDAGDMEPIARKLHEMGITTLYGTQCWHPPEEEENENE